MDKELDLVIRLGIDKLTIEEARKIANLVRSARMCAITESANIVFDALIAAQKKNEPTGIHHALNLAINELKRR
jgi:hypothetical protein